MRHSRKRPLPSAQDRPKSHPDFSFCAASPTFCTEFNSGAYGGYYRPKKVIVLCDAGTISAGFSVAVGFHRLGAALVGTPSAQAPISDGAAAIWKLQHTGIQGMVPMIVVNHFPDDPGKARVLQVDLPLTCQRLASYGFDPNAAYLLALAFRGQAP